MAFIDVPQEDGSTVRKAIAGTLAIWYGDKVWYLYGASSNEDRNYMPNYLHQDMCYTKLQRRCLARKYSLLFVGMKANSLQR